MKRKIIKIDEKKCNGCGLCIPNCPEGAIQIIDGKARLVSDLMCDGLGACLGHCPEGAISIEEREAEEYDERKVMEAVVEQGENTIVAHLAHLKEHGQREYLMQALAYLKEKGVKIPADKLCAVFPAIDRSCPGSRSISIGKKPKEKKEQSARISSELTHWPIQMHLLSPLAPHYTGSNLLLAADCTAFTIGNFHGDFLAGKTLAIACPKLDSNQDIYLDKLVSLIDDAKIDTLTVLIMQVPCCGGLFGLAKKAVEKASRKIPIKRIIINLEGEILSEEWM